MRSLNNEVKFQMRTCCKCAVSTSARLRLWIRAGPPMTVALAGFILATARLGVPDTGGRAVIPHVQGAGHRATRAHAPGPPGSWCSRVLMHHLPPDGQGCPCAVGAASPEELSVPVLQFGITTGFLCVDPSSCILPGDSPGSLCSSRIKESQPADSL